MVILDLKRIGSAERNHANKISPPPQARTNNDNRPALHHFSTDRYGVVMANQYFSDARIIEQPHRYIGTVTSIEYL